MLNNLSMKPLAKRKQRSRGSAHLTGFAMQIHKNWGRVPQFLYFWREKVSAWELSDDSCSASVRTQLVGKNEVFPTGSERFLRLRHLAANDVQIAVAAADGIEELLFHLGRDERYMIMQAVQAAHAGRADRD